MSRVTFDAELTAIAQRVIEKLTQASRTIATAESCTGGLIGGALTLISGSSSVVYGGFITYHNNAKMRMVSVNSHTLDAHGAVSAETAAEMALGAQNAAQTDYAIAVTGVAGPTGGSPDKPVGLVWFGLATPNGVKTEKCLFPNDGRDAIRAATVTHALTMIEAELD